MSLHADTLLRVTESFAEGSFEELFDYKWSDVDSFIGAAEEFVPSKDRAAFAAAVRLAFPS